MSSTLGRAARRALEPNAIILGVATCLFGWALAENLRPLAEYDYMSYRERELMCLSSALLLAAASVATKRALGDLLAVFLSGTPLLILIFSFFMTPSPSEVSFLSVRHVELWFEELSDVRASLWLLMGLSVAILSSATAATLRRTPPRP